MAKAKTIKLDRAAISMWGRIMEFDEIKSEIFKRRFFKNYPMEEKIQFLRILGEERNRFWQHARAFLPNKDKKKTIQYHSSSNKIEILD